MVLNEQPYYLALSIFIGSILLVLLIIYPFTPSPPLGSPQASPTDQLIVGDCHIKQNSRKTRIQCNGDYKFKATSRDGKSINADVSGQNNRIIVRSHNSDATKTNNIAISQSGNGSSVRITFADTPEQTRFDNQWTLKN